jgi:hypothetical protein
LFTTPASAAWVCGKKALSADSLVPPPSNFGYAKARQSIRASRILLPENA